MDATIWWRSPRLAAAAACFLLGVLLLAAGLAPRLAPSAPEPTLRDDALALAEPEPAGPVEPAMALVVYVTGAVAAPDVYRLPQGARVTDAVAAAGGLRDDAAHERVNLAEPLNDAQHVHIPAISEAPPGADTQPMAGGASLLDLNQASAADLEELPGSGATLAGRIIARRSEQGPYTAVEQLNEVTGVGAKLYEQLAPLVSIGS